MKNEEMKKLEPFCPYPKGGYCDLVKCEGKSCMFHPKYNAEREDYIDYIEERRAIEGPAFF